VQAERIDLVVAASPAVLPSAGAADGVFQSLASAPRHIANMAILRYLCQRDGAVARILCERGADDGSLAELADDLDDMDRTTKPVPLEEDGRAEPCRPASTRWLPAKTLLREWLGEEPSPLEVALRSGMRRARRRAASRRRHGNDVCRETNRHDGQHQEVLGPQPPQAADKGGSSRRGMPAIGALGTPQPDHRPAVAARPISTSDTTSPIAATAADGATAA